jgi:hypothetical protein
MKTYFLAAILSLAGGVMLSARTVTTNAAPIVQDPAPTSCVAPCRATFAANASDPDGSIVLYEWLRGGQVIGSGANATTLAVTFDNPVEADVDLRVTDNDGGTSTATAHVSVIAPPPPPVDTTAPIITSLLPLDGSTVPRTGRVTISTSATDNDSLASLELYLDGVLVAGASSPIVKYQWKVPGTKGRRYVIRAVAFDAAGNRGEATVTVTGSR